MSDPAIGLSLDEAAAQLLQPKESETTDEASTEANEQVETQTDTSEDSEQASETSEEVVTAEAEADSQSQEEAEEEADVVETFYEDLYDMAKDRSTHDKLIFAKKVNGVETKVTLKELLEPVEIADASKERFESLKAKEAEFESQKQQQLEAFNNQLSQATGLVTALEQHLTSEYQNTNWEDLREADPAEYSARRQDLLDRQQQINEAKTGIQKEQQQKLNENYQTRLQQERAALMESLPAWADEAVAKQEAADLREYLFAHNISSQEIDGQFDEQGNVVVPALTDHRLILMARKAMLYDKGQAKVDVAKKKVMKVPKVAKPGSKQAQPDEDVEKTKKMRSRLKKSGSLDDAAALIRNSMFGG